MPSSKRRSVSAGAAGPAAQTPANKASSTTRTTYTQEFNPDYSHVIRDLKQIAIMAASFLVILVVLSFFLR
jgi:hypothetical protein